jgi:hypothetical protein
MYTAAATRQVLGLSLFELSPHCSKCLNPALGCKKKAAAACHPAKARGLANGASGLCGAAFRRSVRRGMGRFFPTSHFSLPTFPC